QPNRPRSTPRPGATARNPFSDLEDDYKFETTEMQVAVGKLRESARVVVAARDIPLIVTSTVGRGRITALMFSPEREPFRSWKNLPTFWATLTEVPGEWYVSSDFNQQIRPRSDGICWSMGTAPNCAGALTRLFIRPLIRNICWKAPRSTPRCEAN